MVERELDVGEGTYIAPGVVIDPMFWWLVTIGSNTTLAPDVFILTHDASTRFRVGYTKLARVTIGDGVFIGARSIILPGVTIGDGAVVAASSVVRKDVAPGTVVAGNPAQEVMAVDDYDARQLDRMDGRPVYGREWTVKGGITRAQREQMKRDLSNGGGFVK